LVGCRTAKNELLALISLAYQGIANWLRFAKNGGAMGNLALGSWFLVHGSGFEVQGSRFTVHGSRIKNYWFD